MRGIRFWGDLSQQMSVQAGDFQLIIWKTQLIRQHLQQAPFLYEAAVHQHFAYGLLSGRFLLKTDRRFENIVCDQPEFNQERPDFQIHFAFRQGILELFWGDIFELLQDLGKCLVTYKL
jgi:hypothetical protein